MHLYYYVLVLYSHSLYKNIESCNSFVGVTPLEFPLKRLGFKPLNPILLTSKTIAINVIFVSYTWLVLSNFFSQNYRFVGNIPSIMVRTVSLCISSTLIVLCTRSLYRSKLKNNLY